MDPDTINGTYGDMTFLNGVATFKLKDGEAKTAYSLPSGIRYTVTEETAAGFTTTKTGNIGTIGQETKAEFTNSLTPAAAPTLTAKPQDLNLTYGYTTGSTLGVTAAAATDALPTIGGAIRTGDESNLELWLLTFVMAAAAVIAAIVKKRKKGAEK